MIWFGIGFIVFIILAIYTFREYEVFTSIVLCALYLLLIALICGMINVVVGCAIENDDNMKYKMESDNKIVALKDTQNINGVHYIRSGYISEDLYYYYAVQTEMGYKTEKVHSNDVYIKYTDENPHVEKYVSDFADDYMYLFAFPQTNTKYIIYCPEGTISTEFNVDLE